MIILLNGNENWLISKEKSKIMHQLTDKDMNFSKYECFDDNVLTMCNTYPVMEEKRVVFIDCDDLSILDNVYFKTYLKNPADFTDLVVIVRNVDWRKKFSGEMKKNGFFKFCNKLESEQELICIIQNELNENNATISDDALHELLRRENYLQVDDVTLYSVMNDLHTLIDINSSITTELVSLYIRNNEAENVFSLMNYLSSGNLIELRKQLSVLPPDKAIPTLSLLLREFRLAYKSHVFSSNEIGVKYICLKNLDKISAYRGMKICMDTIDGIKNGSIDAALSLFIAVGKLSTLFN